MATSYVGTNTLSRLETSCTASWSAWTYDGLGRVQTSSQTTPASSTSPFSFHYSYNLDSSVASVTYPSARILQTCYDFLGRPIWVSNSKGTGDCDPGAGNLTAAGDYYASGAQYAAHGGRSQLLLGNGLVETAQFNGRFQPQTLQLGSAANTGNVWELDYSYGSANNNGNLRAQTLTLPNNNKLVIGYRYDKVNRLKAFVENAIACGVQAVRENPKSLPAAQDDIGAGAVDVQPVTADGGHASSNILRLDKSERVRRPGWKRQSDGTAGIEYQQRAAVSEDGGVV